MIQKVSKTKNRVWLDEKRANIRLQGIFTKCLSFHSTLREAYCIGENEMIVLFKTYVSYPYKARVLYDV